MKMQNLFAGVILISGLLSLFGQAADVPAHQMVVGFIPKLDTDPYFAVTKSGAQEAQKEAGSH